MAKATLLYIGSDDGLITLTDPGGIGRWLRAAHELRGTAIQHVWLDPTNALNVLALSAEGLYRSLDGGQAWNRVCDVAGAIGFFDTRVAEHSGVYLADGTSLMRSIDSGATWHTLKLPGVCGACAIDPTGRAFVAIGAQALVSDDDGVTWTPFLAALDYPIEAILALPERNAPLLALAGGVVYRADSRAWHVIDGAPGAATMIAALAGKTPTLLLALAHGGIVRGSLEAWEPTSAPLPWEGPARVLAPAGHHIDIAFSASHEGSVAQSSDRGQSWSIVRQGLPAVNSLTSGRLR